MKAKPGVLALCVLCLAAGVAVADEVSITQPVGGTYKRYTDLMVKWTYTFMQDYPTTANQKEVEIWLARPSSTVSSPNWIDQVGKADVLTGSFKWRINAAPGTYRLHFYKRAAPLAGSVAVSELFTIEPGKVLAPLPHTFVPLNRIDIVSPVAGQEYAIGSTMTITWKKDKIAGYPTVWLQICWPDGSSAAGAYPAPNSGSYQWTIGETAENSLRVSVYTPDNKFKGMSGTFKVKFPPH